jgi:hypothetical protein
MKPTVYIETSIVSYYTSRPSRDLITAARQQITREWWDETSRNFDTYISLLVLQEAEGGDPLAAGKRLNVLAGIPVLKISDEAENLAEILVKERVIPEKCTEDALHIALATVNGIDFLLTWNFTHINNARIKSKIIRIIQRNGYECPVICSPDELTGETTYE